MAVRVVGETKGVPTSSTNDEIATVTSSSSGLERFGTISEHV